MPVLVGTISGDAGNAARDRNLLRRFRRCGNNPRISVGGGGRASHCVGSASHQPESSGEPDGGPPAGSGAATLRWQGGSTIIGIDGPHSNLGYQARDDYDHCLARWEDDGGRVNRLPTLVRAWRRIPNVTMDTTIGHPMHSVINQSEDLAVSGEAGTGWVVPPPASPAVTSRPGLS